MSTTINLLGGPLDGQRYAIATDPEDQSSVEIRHLDSSVPSWFRPGDLAPTAAYTVSIYTRDRPSPFEVAWYYRYDPDQSAQRTADQATRAAQARQAQERERGQGQGQQGQ